MKDSVDRPPCHMALTLYLTVYRRINDQTEDERRGLRLQAWQWPHHRGVRTRQREETQRSEVRAADFVDDKLKGFGPRQSRNLLQGLGLTKYEIHIDGRITGWLNEFGLPVALSPSLP